MKTNSVLLIVVLFLFGLSSYAQNGNGFQAQSELTDDERATIEQRVLEKIDDFISYLPEIAAKKNKSADEQQLAQKYISKALELFIGEGEDYESEDQTGNKRMHEAVKIQTISRGRANSPQPMKRYLNRLMRLPYQRIRVDSAEVYVPEEAVLLEDLRYSCVFNVLLVKIINDEGNMSCGIRNLKKCRLYLSPERYTIGPNGEEQTVWPVKLGNIYLSDK